MLPIVVSAGSSIGELQKSFTYYLLAKDLMICSTSLSDSAALNYFSTAHLSITISACRDAGFNCVTSIPDCVSAVLGSMESGLYSRPPLRHDTVCAIDVGEGIVQLSLSLVKSVPLSIPIVLSQKTLSDSGGIFFVVAIVAHLIIEFKKVHEGIDVSNDKLVLQKFYDAAEASEIELSSSLISKVHIPASLES